MPKALWKSAGMLCSVSITLVSACEAEGALEERRHALVGEHVLVSAYNDKSALRKQYYK